jgi:hypothetical protein
VNDDLEQRHAEGAAVCMHEAAVHACLDKQPDNAMLAQCRGGQGAGGNGGASHAAGSASGRCRLQQ